MQSRRRKLIKRFVVIADTHNYAAGLGKDGLWWNRTLQSLTAEIGEAIIEAIAEFEPEFVIHCGDLTGRCDMVNFEAAVAILDRLGCPWHAVIGNHDSWFQGVRGAFASLHGLPDDRCYYSKQLAGLHFVFLDTCYWKAKNGPVSPYLDKELFDSGMIEGLCIAPEELDWLSAELESHCNEPVVLVSHAPLGFKPFYHVGTFPDGLAGSRNGNSLPEFNRRCGEVGDIVNRVQLRQLLCKHSNIKLALAGHTHINDLHLEDGIAFCQTSSMREYPFEFRVVDVLEDRLSVSTHRLNNLAFSADSLIEERNNHWVAGTENDRSFVVGL